MQDSARSIIGLQDIALEANRSDEPFWCLERLCMLVLRKKCLGPSEEGSFLCTWQGCLAQTIVEVMLYTQQVGFELHKQLMIFRAGDAISRRTKVV